MVCMDQVARDPRSDLAARAIRRVRARLIPFLALLYFIAYLDRLNVGFAALQMNAAIGLSPVQYGRGAGIFFLGYFLFEVPSNLALARIGARLWIARIAIVWGIVSIGTMFVAGPRSFNAIRFLLGAAEAGFFPGIVLYFTYWFPAKERARAVAQFSMASMLAGIVGAPLSGVLPSLRGAGAPAGSTAGSGCSWSKGSRRCCSASSRFSISTTGRRRHAGCRRMKRRGWSRSSSGSGWRRARQAPARYDRACLTSACGGSRSYC